MTEWQLRKIEFKFQISDWSLFSISRDLQVRSCGLETRSDSYCDPFQLPEDPLMEGSEGFLVRAMPISSECPVIGNVDKFIVYIPKQYSHYYIDMSKSFDEYVQKFSSKTRSTINRKVKKFVKESDGKLVWKTYSRPEEMNEFFGLAREVSALSYQERVFDGGIPDSDVFMKNATEKARNNEIRAFILFHKDLPVSYLYCPVENNTLIYAYLGYRPDYRRFSVGTVLQWLALQQLFAEKNFGYFDFTEGESEHKRLFSTNSRYCANVYWLKKSPTLFLIVWSQNAADKVSTHLGRVAEKYGFKSKIKRFFRNRA